VREVEGPAPPDARRALGGSRARRRGRPPRMDDRRRRAARPRSPPGRARGRGRRARAGALAPCQGPGLQARGERPMTGRPEEERSPSETKGPDGSLGKKQLDKFLSSSNDEDEDTQRPDRTLKLAAVEIPDQIVQTMRLPAIEMPEATGSATQEMPV